MKSFLLLFSLSFLVSSAFSQSIIQGKVHDTQTNGISYANVLLRSESDSLLVKGAITDESGFYSFSDIPKGDYFIETFFMGFSKSYIPVFSYSGMETLEIENIILNEESQNLDEVTVVATKPLFELEMGKMVVNVSNSVTSAGLSVIDVLEKSPGVLVNRQNNSMSLSGKNGVVILMNGKRFRMPIEAAFRMLAGLNSSEVEKIEIMTVPPANYDADGDAGFINIVMKRNNGTIGTNGSVTLGQGYGSGYQGNLSFSLMHQGPKFSWFGIVSSSYVDQAGIWESLRSNTFESEDVTIDAYSDRLSTSKSLNYQAGFDYNIGNNTILSGLISGYETRWDLNAPNRTESIYSSSPDTLVLMTSVEENYWSHIMGNINVQHTFGNGQIISANLDYLTYKNSNPTWYNTSYFDNSDDLIRS